MHFAAIAPNAAIMLRNDLAGKILMSCDQKMRPGLRNSFMTTALFL
jgi:hypothetical protein